MSDEQRERIIAEIGAVFGELRRLEVKPQGINFKKLSVEDLEAELRRRLKMIDFERTEDGYKRDLGNGKTLWLKFQLFNIKVAVGKTSDPDFYEDGY